MLSLPHSPPGRRARAVSEHAFQLGLAHYRYLVLFFIFLYVSFLSDLRSSVSLNLGLAELGYARTPHLVWVALGFSQ